MRRAHPDDTSADPARQSLLGAPYDETTAEEGEPLPACERYWPAALIPYMHPATMVAEQSMYWEADPADELALLAEEGGAGGGSGGGGGEDGGPQRAGSAYALERFGEGGMQEGAWAADGGYGGADDGAGPSAGPSPLPAHRTPSRERGAVWPPSRAASSGSGGGAGASAPVEVPGGGRGPFSAAAASAPQGAGSYESGGGLSESFRCGTALRFYRSSSASALKGVLEAALAAQQQQQLAWQEQQGSGGGLTPLQARRPSFSGSVGAPGTPRLEAGPAATSSALTPIPVRPAAAAASQHRGKGRGAALATRQASPARPKAARGSDVRGTCPFITYATSIVICMAGSLAVWPGVTAFICSVHNPAVVSPCAPRAAPYGRLAGDLFVPAMFVIYALGDVTGRIAAGWGPWGRRPPAAASLLLYSLSRLGVVSALLLCHVVTPAPWQLPYLLQTDWWPLGLVLALGLTQGHLLSTACMHAPAVLPPGREARFGPVTGFCITAGCLAGSVVSTVLVESFTRSDPGVGLGYLI